MYTFWFLHFFKIGIVQGTDKVEAIVTSLEGSKKLTSFEAISQMKNLRLLMIFDPDFICGNDSLTSDLEYLSKKLRLLQWDAFPYKGFPSSFQPYRLVKLKLVYSSIEKLWNKLPTVRISFKLFMWILLEYIYIYIDDDTRTLMFWRNIILLLCLI